MVLCYMRWIVDSVNFEAMTSRPREDHGLSIQRNNAYKKDHEKDGGLCQRWVFSSLLFHSAGFPLCFLIWLFPLTVSDPPALGIRLFSSHKKIPDTPALGFLIDFLYFRCQYTPNFLNGLVVAIGH